MPDIILASSDAYNSDGLLPTKRMENLYVERSEASPDAPYVLRQVPGYREKSIIYTGTQPTGGIRGIKYDDAPDAGATRPAYFVVDGQNRQVDLSNASSSAAQIGNLSSTTGRVVIETNIDWELILDDQGDLYAYSIAGNTWEQLGGTMAAFGQVVEVGHSTSGMSYTNYYPGDFVDITVMNDFFFGVNDYRIYWSQGNNPTRWNELDGIEADASPDRQVAIQALGQRVYVFGTRMIEVVAPKGGSESQDFFGVQTGLEFNIGALNRDCVQRVRDAIFFVSSDRSVYAIGGAGQIQAVSTPHIDAWLDTENRESLCAFHYFHKGHFFYVIRGLLGCYQYDITTQLWSRLKGYGSETWPFDFCTPSRYGSFLFSSTSVSRWAWEDTVYTFDGDARIWLVDGHSPSKVHIEVDDLEVVGTKGPGLVTGQGSDPVMNMRFADDGFGRDWSDQIEIELGAIGDYGHRPYATGLGMIKPPGRVWEFTGSEPLDYAISHIRFNEFANGAA